MSKPISELKLPYKEGYIEIETDNGERIYQITPEQLEKERLQKENIELQAKVTAQETAMTELFINIIPSLIAPV